MLVCVFVCGYGVGMDEWTTNASVQFRRNSHRTIDRCNLIDESKEIQSQCVSITISFCIEWESQLKGDEWRDDTIRYGVLIKWEI